MYSLYNNDMFDIFPTIEEKSIDLIFVDLPYNTTNCKWDVEVDLEKFWKESKRVLKDNGVVIATAQIPFSIKLGMSNLKDLKYEWIWEKTQGTGHLNAKKMPMKCHENILIFYKKLPTYNPIKTTGHKRKISTAHHKRNTSTGDIYSKCDTFSDYDSTERYPRSVIKFKSDKQKSNLHPTQKPLSLLEYIIKTYSNEGDTILDPCCGSGTTGVAALKNNRKCILIEKDENYYNITKERIEKYNEE